MLLYSLEFSTHSDPSFMHIASSTEGGSGGCSKAPLKCSLTPAPSAWYSQKEYLVTAPGPYRWILIA